MVKPRSKKRRGGPAGRRGEGGGGASKLFKANLAALRQHHPHLAQLASQPPDARRVRPVVDAQGRLRDVAVPGPGGAELRWHGNADDLDALWARTQWRGRSFVALFGLGAGRELTRLLSDRDLLVRRMVIIEPDPDIFRLVLRHVDLVQALSSPYIRFFVGLKLVPLRAALLEFVSQARNLRYSKTLTIVAPDGATRVAGAYHREAVKCLHAATVRAAQALGNAPQDSLMGLENVLRNLPEIIRAPGVKALAGRFKGRPAVVASAGPSLAKQFDKLKALQDDVLIVCPDTSLKALLPEGIQPHLVCSRERVPGMVIHFQGAGGPRTWLAGVPVIDPACYEAFQGPSLSIFRKAAHFAWLALDRGFLDFQGSGGNMAFRLAQELGCDPVVLIGQDLAYSDSGDTHSSGTMHGSKSKLMDKHERIKVPGNDGRPVMSTPNWIRFRELFEHDIAQRGGACVNSTEGGALIRGAKVMPFAQAIERFMGPGARCDVRERLAGLLPRADDDEAARQARHLHRRIEETRRRMQGVIRDCQEGREQVRQAVAEADPQAFAGYPQDVRRMLDDEPLASLDKARVTITRTELFEEFMIPTALPVLLHWDMRVYGRQTDCADGAELFAALLPEYDAWFSAVEQLTFRSLELLPWGEHTLHEAFPDAVPPPSQPLPARTMAEVISEAQPDIQYT